LQALANGHMEEGGRLVEGHFWMHSFNCGLDLPYMDWRQSSTKFCKFCRAYDLLRAWFILCTCSFEVYNVSLLSYNFAC